MVNPPMFSNIFDTCYLSVLEFSLTEYLLQYKNKNEIFHIYNIMIHNFQATLLQS